MIVWRNLNSHFFIGGLFVLTGISGSVTGDFILKVAAGKMSVDFIGGGVMLGGTYFYMGKSKA